MTLYFYSSSLLLGAPGVVEVVLSSLFIPPLPNQVQQTGTMADHEALAEQVKEDILYM